LPLGTRSQLGEARRVIANLCERMGLEAYGAPLARAYVQNSPEETRRELVAVVHVAGVVHKVAEAFHMRSPKSSDLGEVASCALVLEAEAGNAIRLCDRVIRERAELAAQKTERPILTTGRHMNLHRSGGDR
jgi:hypothetical protein